MNGTVKEKRAGYVDVKSFATGVHFNVQRNIPLLKSDTVVTYQIIQMNDGRAMNANSGVFAAPAMEPTNSLSPPLKGIWSTLSNSTSV